MRRQEKSFLALFNDELNQLTDNYLFEMSDEEIKLLESSFNSSEIHFLELKKIKNLLSSTYRFQDGVYDTQNIIADLLPEYDSFRSRYKEDIRSKPAFEINNYKIPFFLPRLFSGFEGHIMTLENPLFFNKQRKNVYKMLQYHADIFYANQF